MEVGRGVRAAQLRAELSWGSVYPNVKNIAQSCLCDLLHLPGLDDLGVVVVLEVDLGAYGGTIPLYFRSIISMSMVKKIRVQKTSQSSWILIEGN